MSNIIVIVVLGNLASFLAGAFVVKQMQPKEENKKTVIEKITHPVETIKEDYRSREEKRRTEQEQREFNIMMENIDNYNGSSAGQKEVI